MSENSTQSSGSPLRKSVALPVVVAVVALLVTAAMAPGLFNGGDSEQREDAPVSGINVERGEPSDDDPAAAVVRRDADDPLARGDVDAPVVMVNYSEFQCPFCGRFARDTEPALIDRFVEDGTLRIEWRDFPYLGPESTTAAQAGRAAAAQGKFWDYHEALFAEQQPPNQGKVTEDYLVGIAERLGLDTAQFRRDMKSDAVAKAVAKDFEEGQSLGVNGTPAFLINGQPVMGAQPTEVFVEIIEQAAKASR